MIAFFTPPTVTNGGRGFEEHFETEKEVWFVFPMKEPGEAGRSVPADTSPLG